MKNEEIIENEEEAAENHRKSLIKFLPSTITLAAFCCGLTAIRFALFQRWELAILSIFAAALLDACDGRVARAIGQSSQIGAQLDSLSDLVCFGVAPAIVLFLRTMYSLGSVGWGICMFFTVCCALRLARFNAQQLESEKVHDPIEKKFFTGVPAPAGAMIAVLPMILFFVTEKSSFLSSGFVAFCLLFSGAMMISTLRTFSSKMVKIDSKSALISLIAIALCVICLITDVWLTLSCFVLGYIISIPCGVFEYNKLRAEEAEIFDTQLSDKIDEISFEEKKKPVETVEESSIEKDDSKK